MCVCHRQPGLVAAAGPRRLEPVTQDAGVGLIACLYGPIGAIIGSCDALGSNIVRSWQAEGGE